MDILTLLEELGERQLAGNSVRTVLVSVLVVALGWLLGRMARYVLTRWVLRLTAKTRTNIDNKLIERSARPISLTVLLASLAIAVDLLTLPAKVNVIAHGAVLSAIALTIAVLLMRVVDVFFEEVLEPWAQRQNPPVNVQVLHVGQVTLKIVAGTVAMVTVLQRTGFDVWSVITGLGIGGMAVALAAQQTLGNWFGGMQVMTDRPFQVGDWIRIDGNFGRVLQIGMRSTRMQNTAGLTFVIPNKHIAETTIENHMAPQGQVREFLLGLPYETPAARLDQICAEIRVLLMEHPQVHSDVSVLVWNFGDWAVQLRVIYRVPDAQFYGPVAHDVNLAIKKRLEELGQPIAFPTRTLHVASVPAPATVTPPS